MSPLVPSKDTAGKNQPSPKSQPTMSPQVFINASSLPVSTPTTLSWIVDAYYAGTAVISVMISGYTYPVCPPVQLNVSMTLSEHTVGDLRLLSGHQRLVKHTLH